ncbi:DUF5694 domain-containing protein [Erythrobacter sp. GH1-10]|uniref:DUF5694 domain-containing protein n=1 Tax=Erythrobacter sp. GH1-10 TaxID=3349334 RepID=UPI003877F96B
MFRTIITGLAFALTSVAASAQDTPEPTPDAIQVMVFGTYHFANPGRDVINLEVDDVLTPQRQREIEVLVQTLAQWNPTKVAVESRAAAPGLELEGFDEVQELLASTRNESVQIGFRLAHTIGLKTVYGIDEQPGEGEPDYFPIGKVQAYAQANGQGDLLEQLFSVVQERIGAEQAKLPRQSIAESLIFHNDAAVVDAGHDAVYYPMLSIGNGDEQPGAELNAYWYMRNAKMFAKLDLVAEPGDRVFLIVGSGHATWLRHFVRRMPGYELVDAMPYVLGAAAASEAIAE